MLKTETPYAMPLTPLEKTEFNLVMSIYALYTVGLVLGLLGPVIGFGMALYQRKKISTELCAAHLKGQIRIVLLSLSLLAAGIVFALLAAWLEAHDHVVLIGVLLMVLAAGVFELGALVGMLRLLMKKKTFLR